MNEQGVEARGGVRPYGRILSNFEININGFFNICLFGLHAQIE